MTPEEKYFSERHEELQLCRKAGELDLARAIATEIVHMFAKASPRFFDNGCVAEDSFLFDVRKNLLHDALFLFDSGWMQLDATDECGVWFHIERRKIVSYAEGDLCVIWAPTAAAFTDMIGRFRSFTDMAIAS